MMRVIGGTSAYGIGLRVDEETAAADFLFERVIDRHRGARHDVLVIDVRNDAHDAPRFRADVDELDHRIGPHQSAVDGILGGEQSLRHALADDHDLVGVSTIGIGEVAARDNRDAQGSEESGRDGAEPCSRILFAVRLRVSFRGELRFEEAFVPPRHGRADRDPLHAGHLTHAPDDLSVEAGDLLRFARVGHDRHVQRQDVACLEPRMRPLQTEQRRQQHARAGEQDERGGNLRDREEPEASVGGGRDPDAAVRQTESIRGARRRQSWDECQEDGGRHRQNHTNPQQARIDGHVECANRKARGVARQHGDHRPGDQDAREQRRHRRATGSRRAAFGAVRPRWRRAPREWPARPGGERSARESGSPRSSRRR